MQSQEQIVITQASDTGSITNTMNAVCSASERNNNILSIIRKGIEYRTDNTTLCFTSLVTLSFQWLHLAVQVSACQAGKEKGKNGLEKGVVAFQGKAKNVGTLQFEEGNAKEASVRKVHKILKARDVLKLDVPSVVPRLWRVARLAHSLLLVLAVAAVGDGAGLDRPVGCLQCSYIFSLPTNHFH